LAFLLSALVLLLKDELGNVKLSAPCSTTNYKYQQMKKIFIVLQIIISISWNIQAKEGMWLPFLLETLNQKDMQAMGMKITAKDLYNENKSSLKDAIVLFGSGCTGEVISNQGLVLTNHHCGYGTVQGLSSLQNDYFKNGFWAMNNQEELACGGLSVTFINKIIDVTSIIKKDLPDNMLDSNRAKLVSQRSEQLIKENTKDGYNAIIKSFFYDNKYYMFITEKFTDIRLVGFPPNSIGKFGGDTDNWAWPRHTGDFSLFRIYANKENKPAAYNKDNVPYKPKKSLDISLKGVKEGDFTMVYGFPGRTSEYLTSGGVNEIMNVLDPARIKIREARLKIMEADMRADRKVFVQYTGKQASIANYYKKWQGELKGLQINDAVNKKITKEQEFISWAYKHKLYSVLYGTVIEEINNLYKAQEKSALLNEYFVEAFGASEVFSQSAKVQKIINKLNESKSIDSIQKMKSEWEAFYKNYNKETDRKITAAMMDIFHADFPDIQTEALSKDAELYDACLVSNENEMMEIFKAKSVEDALAIFNADRGLAIFNEMDKLKQANNAIYRKTFVEIESKYHTYMQGLQTMHYGKAMYPDANSTLRIGYGKVQGLTPSDGLEYKYYTTLDGVMQKENPNIEEFEVSPKLKALHKAKDYGPYKMSNGQLPLAFLASNHSTGGNSGSPVLNAYGQLIGTNFDRIYEGTMSDIMYDINLCRNITVDIRYTLFIIDKFAGASWLLKEMKIVK
jgi:hypothetical protein